MRKKRSKRYEKAASQREAEKHYNLEEAVKLLKNFPLPKFDPTVTLSFRMGVNPRKSDQMVRGSVSLPHGTGKTVRVAVFAEGAAADQAKEAGAEFIGVDELIQKIQGGFTDFDVAIATPAAMTKVRKIARVLGPRGLMPNPRTGTVTDDVAQAVNEVKAGRIDYKLDKNGNISGAIGRASFSEKDIQDNALAFIDSVVRAKPASAKGDYVRNVTLAAAMCPGLRLAPSLYSKQD